MESPPSKDALDDLVGFLPNLFISIVIIVVVGAIASRVAGLVSELLADQTYGTTVSRTAGAAIWVVGIFAALDQIEIADDVLNVLLIALVSTIGLTIAVMFGISGIQATRDRFWPAVFDRFGTSHATDAAGAEPTSQS